MYTFLTAPVTAKHQLQTYLNYGNEKNNTWQHPIPFHEKLYGDTWNLYLTTALIIVINVNV
jgi:hypothetical protein